MVGRASCDPSWGNPEATLALCSSMGLQGGARTTTPHLTCLWPPYLGGSPTVHQQLIREWGEAHPIALKSTNSSGRSPEELSSRSRPVHYSGGGPKTGGPTQGGAPLNLGRSVAQSPPWNSGHALRPGQARSQNSPVRPLRATGHTKQRKTSTCTPQWVATILRQSWPQYCNNTGYNFRRPNIGHQVGPP